MASLLITKPAVEIDHKRTGEAMRARREKAGVSLTVLAPVFGASLGYVSRLECGLRPWTEERAELYVAAIAKAAKSSR